MSLDRLECQSVVQQIFRINADIDRNHGHCQFDAIGSKNFAKALNEVKRFVCRLRIGRFGELRAVKQPIVFAHEARRRICCCSGCTETCEQRSDTNPVVGLYFFSP